MVATVYHLSQQRLLGLRLRQPATLAPEGSVRAHSSSTMSLRCTQANACGFPRVTVPSLVPRPLTAYSGCAGGAELLDTKRHHATSYYDATSIPQERGCRLTAGVLSSVA